jgi:hypothetical protein
VDSSDVHLQQLGVPNNALLDIFAVTVYDSISPTWGGGRESKALGRVSRRALVTSVDQHAGHVSAEVAASVNAPRPRELGVTPT